MPRVIAGTAGGRPLRVPAGRDTRPTADRVKEALFSSLGDVSGAVVLDLYAGSGGLAIEALSRGAARAVLVEHDRRALAVLRANLATAGVTDRATVVAVAVRTFCTRPSGGPFDLVLADPPYRVGGDQLAGDLDALADAGVLVDGARVVLERASRTDEPPPARLVHQQDRFYGETLLRYGTYRRGTTDPPTPQGAPPP